MIGYFNLYIKLKWKIIFILLEKYFKITINTTFMQRIIYLIVNFVDFNCSISDDVLFKSIDW